MITIYTYNTKVLKNAVNDNWYTKPEPPDPYNPLRLPPNTVRVRTSDGNPPVKDSSATFETATLVTGTTDEYDVYKSGTDFSNLFIRSTNVVEVLGANTAGITNMANMFGICDALTTVALFNTTTVLYMDNMFASCSSLTTVPLFDTSSVTSMMNMFYRCSSITTVPLFDTSSVDIISGMFSFCTSLTSVPVFNTSSATTMLNMFYGCSALTAVPLLNTSNVWNMNQMFYNCINVQSGAHDLYWQALRQTTPPSKHSQTFYNCGSNTTTGAADLARISYDWK